MFSVKWFTEQQKFSTSMLNDRITTWKTYAFVMWLPLWVLISSQYVNDDESSNLELIIYYITQLNKFWPWFGSLVFICSGQVDDIILLKFIESW